MLPSPVTGAPKILFTNHQPACASQLKGGGKIAVEALTAESTIIQTVLPVCSPPARASAAGSFPVTMPNFDFSSTSMSIGPPAFASTVAFSFSSCSDVCVPTSICNNPAETENLQNPSGT